MGVRARLLVAVVAITALAAAALVSSFNYILADRLTASATAAARARAEAELEALHIREGRIVPAEAPDAGIVESPVWILDQAGHTLEAPPGNAALRQAAESLAREGARTVQIAALDARLYAVPVITGARPLGTVVAAVSTKPYQETQQTALIGSVILALTLLGAITLAARWILRAALAPVTEMTASAATWSERDLDRRFNRGAPYDELTELAATLDSLLDRLAGSLRHEQRFAAELSHELRTPLTRISGEAELALSKQRHALEYQEGFEAVYRDAQQMTRTIDALVAVARHESGLARSSSDARDAVTRAIEASRPLAAANGIEISLEVPHAPVWVAAEDALVERIVQPLLENACHYGRHRVAVTLVRSGAKAVITLSDDGPGVLADERETIFEPGVRGHAGARSTNGSGLGLALAARVAQSAGGAITAHASLGGGCFIVELPLA